MKEIIKNIVLAQIASDAGKGYYDYNGGLKCKNDWLAQTCKYNVKDHYIEEAIKLIDTNYNGSINYYRDGNAIDQNGHSSVIIYFDIKTASERMQISFHSFNYEWMGETRGRKTRWKKTDSSRENCRKLIELYDL